MLDDKQNQTVENSSTAVQAGRDINIIQNGLSESDITELFYKLFNNNFPKLMEESIQTAEKRMVEFMLEIVNSLKGNKEAIILDKFKDPDVQATLVDAIRACARKGQAANPHILSKLIIERIAIQTNDFKDIIISEAIKAVPSLTTTQIALLSFHHFAMSMVKVSTISDFEIEAQNALKFSKAAFGLSDTQKMHLCCVGVMTPNNCFIGEVYNKWYKFNNFDLADQQAFRQAIIDNAPAFGILLDQFDSDELMMLQMTPVGRAIAMANISNYTKISSQDYNNWLN